MSTFPKIFFFLVIVFGVCNSNAQTRAALDSVWVRNLKTFKMVAKGKFDQHKLTPAQNAFLILIMNWTDENVSFDHNKGFYLTVSNIRDFNTWYERNREQILLEDYELYFKNELLFVQGTIIPDSVLMMMDSISKKYQRVNNLAMVRTNRHIKKLRKSIAIGLNHYNSFKTAPKDIGIWIHSVSSIKNNCAVYNFERIATHQPVRDIFIFEHGKIVMLNSSDFESVEKAVRKFLERQSFSPKEKSECLKQVATIIHSDNSNVF